MAVVKTNIKGHQLNSYQIGAVAYEAGFRDGELAKAIAIALAESNGWTAARNSTGNSPPSTDRGLWQFNSHWHPEVTDTCADTPSCAAKAAFRISNGGKDWSQWSTDKGPSYVAHLPGATIAARKVQKDGGAVEDLPWSVKIGTHLPGLPTPLEQFSNFVGFLMNPQSWVRILMVMGGATGMILGLMLLARDLKENA